MSFVQRRPSRPDGPLLAADHLRARHVSLLIEEVQVAFFLLHANLRNLGRLAALLPAAGHLRPRDIPLLVDEVQITVFTLHASFGNFLRHEFLTSVSSFPTSRRKRRR